MARQGRGGGNARAPAPLTPADCDLACYRSMMVDIPRLKQSDFDATPDDTAWRAGLNLWFSAWESVPAGSLRADDASLCRAAGLGRDLRVWGRVKATAMQGFILCSDGRVYHRTVCAHALSSWLDKLIRRLAGAKGNQRHGHVDLDAIKRQIAAAAGLLYALEPLSPTLAKVRRIEGVQIAFGSQSERIAPAMGAQEKVSEGNGLREEVPSQNEPGTLKVVAGGGR